MVAIHYVGMIAVGIMVFTLVGHLNHVHFLRNKNLIREVEKTHLLSFPWSPLYPGETQRNLTVVTFLVLPLLTAIGLTALLSGNQP